MIVSVERGADRVMTLMVVRAAVRLAFSSMAQTAVRSEIFGIGVHRQHLTPRLYCYHSLLSKLEFLNDCSESDI